MKKDLQKLELLSAYLDGELSDKEKAEIEKLLSTSLELQKNLEDLKKVKQLGNLVKRIPESPFFETRLMAEIEGRKGESSGIKKWIPASALIVVSIVLMIVLKLNPSLID